MDVDRAARADIGARITSTAVIRMWLGLPTFDGGAQPVIPL
jgi:hypothetical protein